MAGGPGHHKKMPDKVTVTQAPIDRIKRHPGRVRHAAGKEQEQKEQNQKEQRQ